MSDTIVNVVLKTSGQEKLDKLNKALLGLDGAATKSSKNLPAVAKSAKAAGAAAKGATGGVRALDVAFKSLLGPISLAVGGLTSLSAVFNTIANQDFAEAKFASLGGNADELRNILSGVSKELQGQASVVELTAAAYDVASAGFTSAAESAAILKAASQGATGGFSDINTVGNAATSVLNAYGLSADKAGKLVDQFVQTQNDGKIVVAEYAANIGKVASAAAGLNVPLSEVNAVIAQSTAAGVQAEVAFTGLKGALARLASGEAAKALEGTGIEINAATIEADGLFGTLKKLEGLDTGTLFKALGTEAGPALLPVIQNLERYEELIKNQEDATGVAAQAAATASGTIEGAWNRVTVAFQNLFSDQAELGQIIRGTLLSAAATVEAFAAAFKLAIAPIRGVINAIGKVVGAVLGIKDSEKALQDFTATWFKILDAVEFVADIIVFQSSRIGNFLAGLVENVREFFGGLFSGISSGVNKVGGVIVNAFRGAFTNVLKLAQSFFNLLPDWLKGALEGGVGAIKGALGAAIDFAGNEIEFVLNNARGASGINIRGDSRGSRGGGDTTSGNGKGSGSGRARGKKVKDVTKDVEALVRKANEAAQSFDTLFAAPQNPLEAAISSLNDELLETDKELEGILLKLDELTKGDPRFDGARSQISTLRDKLSEFSKEDIKRQASRNLTKGDREGLEESIREAEALSKALGQGRTELTALEKLAVKYGEAWEQLDLGVKQNLTRLAEQSDLLNANNKKALEALETQRAAAAELNSLYQGIGDTIQTGIIDAIDAGIEGLINGTKDLDKALQEIAAGVLKDIGMMLLKTGLNAALSGLGGNDGVGFFSKLFPKREQGGPVSGNSPYIVGEKGPELFVPSSAGTIVPNDALGRETLDRYTSGSSNERNPAPMNFSFNTVRIADEDYVSKDQLESAMRVAARQGADGGFNKTMTSLKNNRSTRSSVGV